MGTIVSQSRRWLVWLLASVPFCHLALLGLFILRARWHLGRWPTPSNPDPKALDFDWHLELVELTIAGLPVVVLLMMGVALWRQSEDLPVRWKPVLVALFGTATVFTVYAIDPGYFCAWLLD